MILGVGFIMLAAIFPVAIQQAQTSSDETVSASIAWNAITTIQEKLSDTDLPVTALSVTGPDSCPSLVRSFRDPQADQVPTLRGGRDATYVDYVVGLNEKYTPRRLPTFSQRPDYLWNRIKGESVVVDDRRYAWGAFYRRHIVEALFDSPSPYVHLIVVVARSRESSTYGIGDLDPASQLVNLQPRPVNFNLTSDGNGPIVDQVIRIRPTGRGNHQAVAEGAFLVIAHDELPYRAVGPQTGYLNASVFRIGNHIGGDRWELSPETQFVPPVVAGTPVTGLTGAHGYVIGRTRVADGRFEGPAQDLAVYSMLIAMR